MKTPKKAPAKKPAVKKVIVPVKVVGSGKSREDLYEVGKNKPPKATQFSATNQPDPEKQKETWKKKRFTRDLIKEMLQMKYKFTADSQVKQQLVNAYGEEVLDLSIGQIMTLQQMQKAILKGDTQAYSIVIDQALGKQVQAVQNVDADGNDTRPIMLSIPKGMKFDLPSNIEGDGEEEGDEV